MDVIRQDARAVAPGNRHGQRAKRWAMVAALLLGSAPLALSADPLAIVERNGAQV